MPDETLLQSLPILMLGTAWINAAAPAQAALITAFEVLQDSRGNSDDVSLARERYDGAASVYTVDSAAILADNQVSAHFGRTDAQAVSFRHLFDWVTHGTPISATLEIVAKGVQALTDETAKDYVYTLGVNSDPGMTWSVSGSGITLSTFDIDPEALAGNTLAVSLQKAAGDSIEVLRSKLTVTWDDAEFEPFPPPIPQRVLSHPIADSQSARPELREDCWDWVRYAALRDTDPFRHLGLAGP